MTCFKFSIIKIDSSALNTINANVIMACHPWLVEVVVRCIHIWSWRNVDPGLGPTASSCPVSSDVDPVVCGDT